ncbi:MAG: tyrosine--tRNA ligase [bacterium]|nr:tyrosine--tRNA ligase [bacterium]
MITNDCNEQQLSHDQQLEIIMRGTRFADETDDWIKNADKCGNLRKQMREELHNKLKLGRPLRVYLGVDPTSTSLHVGHFVPIQKLRKLQELGHHIVFLIGDYTATIGDPSGQAGERKRFTHEEVSDMAKNYTNLAFKVLDPEKTEVRLNSEWLAKLQFSDIIELACIFPMKQIISRRDFQARMDRGESLRFHEALYSLMQGYDAYKLDCDIQVAGYDQHFNLLAGRNIQEHFGQVPHVMLTNPLIIGTDGRKMSKSYNNTINIDDSPNDMYGKTMRVADEQLHDYLELTSSLSTTEIDELLEQLKSGKNPMQAKKQLAFNLVEQYHSREDAERAENNFYQVVQQKNISEDAEKIEVSSELMNSNWMDLCFAINLCKSKSEIRRLIQQGGFSVNQQQMKDINAKVEIPIAGVHIKIGKRKFYHLVQK